MRKLCKADDNVDYCKTILIKISFCAVSPQTNICYLLNFNKIIVLCKKNVKYFQNGVQSSKNLNSNKAEVFLNPDWRNLVLADLFRIGRVFFVLAEFRALLARFNLYQADKLIRFSSNISKLNNNLQLFGHISLVSPPLG